MTKKGKATISVDEDLYKKFKEFCQKELGLEVSQVIRLFMKKFLEGKIDLEFVRREEKENQN